MVAFYENIKKLKINFLVLFFLISGCTTVHDSYKVNDKRGHEFKELVITFSAWVDESEKLSKIEASAKIRGSAKCKDSPYVLTDLRSDSYDGFSKTGGINIISANIRCISPSVLAAPIVPEVIKLENNQMAVSSSQLPVCSFNDKRNCTGSQNFISGDKYVGEFKDGIFNGQGIYTKGNIYKYEGGFKAGKFSGSGTLNYGYGDGYIGEFKYKYEGGFTDGKFSGSGTLTFGNGERYIGEFKDGSFNGQGIYTKTNGYKYEGSFRFGKSNGNGTLIYGNGDKYVGEFKDDKFFAGIGTTHLDGNRFVGEIKDGKFEGQVTVTYADGKVYQGDFKDGKRNGNGKLSDANGSLLYSGLWKDDKFSPPAPKSDVRAKSSGPESTGSAFRVAKGVFITNNHVVDGCNNVFISGQPAQVIQIDRRTDLAQLSAQLDGPVARLRGQRAGIGEAVAVTGFPLRSVLTGFNMTTGTISSMSGIGGNTQYFQITAPVQPGNSGGPMLDSAGNLMGVVVSKLDVIKMLKATGDIPQNVNFAINTNSLRSFLDAGALNYSVAGNEPAIPLTTIAERARGFTVLVECYK